MSYENGTRLNHYAKKQIHKNEQKKTKIRIWGCHAKSYEDFLIREEKRYYGVHRWYRIDDEKIPYYQKYWRRYDESSMKTYAKKQTNKRVRQHNKAIIQNYLKDETSDNLTMDHSFYQQFFDYAWTVW